MDRPQQDFVPLPGVSPGQLKKVGEANILFAAKHSYSAHKKRRLFNYIDDQRLEKEKERPDFLVRSNGAIVGIELIAVTSQSRRNAHAVVERLKRALVETGESAPHLKNLSVTVHSIDVIVDEQTAFGKRGRNLQPLVRAILDSEPLILAQSDEIQNANPIVLEAPNGWVVTFGRSVGVPDGNFVRAMGFDLGFAFSNSFDEDTLFAEVQRHLDGHTGYFARDVLLSFAAPDPISGLWYPGDILLFDILKRALATRQLRSDHFERAILHDFRKGRIFVSSITPMTE